MTRPAALLLTAFVLLTALPMTATADHLPPLPGGIDPHEETDYVLEKVCGDPEAGSCPGMALVGKATWDTTGTCPLGLDNLIGGHCT